MSTTQEKKVKKLKRGMSLYDFVLTTYGIDERDAEKHYNDYLPQSTIEEDKKWIVDDWFFNDNDMVVLVYNKTGHRWMVYVLYNNTYDVPLGYMSLLLGEDAYAINANTCLNVEDCENMLRLVCMILDLQQEASTRNVMRQKIY